MKTTIQASPTITSAGLQGSVMGMSAKGMEIASMFLRDRIYSDKIGAVIREYITNAADEHKKHKIDKEIEVRMWREKTSGAMWWGVRDFALGLSEHDIRNVFGQYFESTKSHSNEYVGGLGIGSKSFFAFTDSFYITSHHQGICSKYIASLGGSDSGVAVGSIYKISEEPTKEQGIEISADVEKEDWDFRAKTQKFVELFDPTVGLNFKYLDYDLDYTIQPFSQKYIDGFTINQYKEDVHDSYGTSYAIRMGGVIYSSSAVARRLRQIGDRLNNTLTHNVIIDVPIGTFSVPISREGLEETPANDKSWDKIEKMLKDLRDEEKTTLQAVPPSLGSLFGGDNAVTKLYNGDYFVYRTSELFPDTCSVFHIIQSSGMFKPVANANGKYVVYVFPVIQNIKNWQKRLQLVIGDTTGYLYTLDTQRLELLETSTEIDASDVEFVRIKSLGLPKLASATGTQKFLVYSKGTRLGMFTADELEEYAISKTGKDVEDEWWKNVKDTDELKTRLIYRSEGSFDCHYAHYVTRSIKLAAAMVELGWMEPKSQEIEDKRDELQALEAANRQRERVAQDCKQLLFYIPLHPNVVSLVMKDNTKIDRLKHVRKLILAEDSPRAKILKMYDNHGYYAGDKLTRQDLRKILSLK